MLRMSVPPRLKIIASALEYFFTKYWYSDQFGSWCMNCDIFKGSDNQFQTIDTDGAVHEELLNFVKF